MGENGQACHVKCLWLYVNCWGTHLAGTCLLTQLLVQDGCDLLSIGCHLFLQVSRVWHTIPSNWGDVCLLHHFYQMHYKALQAYTSCTEKCGICYHSLAAHHLHHTFILALHSRVKLHLRISCVTGIDLYFKNVISCSFQLLVGLHWYQCFRFWYSIYYEDEYSNRLISTRMHYTVNTSSFICNL